MNKFMTEQIESLSHTLKPFYATVLGAVGLGGNAAVWMDMIKGGAALVTVVIGAPTAFFIMAYWALKVRREWRNRNASTKEYSEQ
jgi:hypothetical protein